jgi:hypothetical protein
MIKAIFISFFLILDTTSWACIVTPQPYAQSIAEGVGSSKRRALQSVCPQLESVGETTLYKLLGAQFNCDCSSGSTYSLVCQGSEMCCDDICGTITWSASFSSSMSPIEEQYCATYSSPADIAGQKRCGKFDYCGSTICGCSGTVDGEACGACETCQEATQTQLGLYAVNCTNIAGFEDMPATCEETNKFLALGCSTAHRSTTIISLGFASAILVAVSIMF